MSDFWDRASVPAHQNSPFIYASSSGYTQTIESVYDAPTYGDAFVQLANANSQVRVNRAVKQTTDRAKK
jgi:hypothetical protein